MTNTLPDYHNHVMGIDEAGRGCVIGPLIIGAVIWPSHHLKELELLGVKDSKAFVSKKEKILRTYLAEELEKKAVKSSIRAIEPSRIDEVLQKKRLYTSRVSSKTYSGTNLNFLEIYEMAQCILQHPCKEVFIDALSTPAYFLQHLKKTLQAHSSSQPLDITINLSESCLKIIWKDTDVQDLGSTIVIAKNKGDKLFPIVSAASIVAKVYRDRNIRELETKHGLPTNFLASGYANNQLLPFLERYRKEISEKQFSFIRYQWDWEPLQKVLQPFEHTMKQKSILDVI